LPRSTFDRDGKYSVITCDQKHEWSITPIGSADRFTN